MFAVQKPETHRGTPFMLVIPRHVRFQVSILFGISRPNKVAKFVRDQPAIGVQEGPNIALNMNDVQVESKDISISKYRKQANFPIKPSESRYLNGG